MLTKPFVFVVQVVAAVFGTEAAEYASVLTDPSHDWKDHHGIEIRLRDHRCLIEEAILPFVPTPTHAPTSVTSAASDLPKAIRSCVPPSNFSGPGSGTPGEMLTKPFVFVVQVSSYLPAPCYRSDNRFLVLLPRPLGSFFSCICIFGVDLLVCGDIEANPGPSDKEILQQLLSGQKNMTDMMNSVLSKQEKIEKEVASLTERMSSVEMQTKPLIELKTDVNDLKQRATQLEKDLEFAVKKIDELENRSRRNNLIVFGLREEANETTADLTEIIKTDLFEGKLGVNVSGIERCHRLGKKNGKERPVIIKILDYRDKVAILQRCSKLKGTELSISEDFSARVRDIRKKLWQSSSRERTNGSKVKLVYDKISIDGKIFCWDDDKNKRYKLSNQIKARGN
ncbi:uncharacterized protein LOC119372211 [Rhipicephalus sanguineus]|uniref:uncharacterized protein LOC119372211 n=1 Tax=Rhipicephalus sanguineus TaxID=34632 RepID=UPI001894530A|nr:uncharacterized protein LOC119372211 [Rhipicephalus sanguineus]